LATLLLTLRGTPFIYYGDEIGMQNRRIPRSRIRDRYGRLFYPFYTGRDKCCTPMQWNDSSYAGFSRATPWLPVHPDYKTDNVRIQKGDDNSIWNYYRQLIRLRRNYPVLQSGEIHFLNKGERMYLLYERSMISGSLWIAVNFSPFSRKIKEWRILKGKQVVLSTHPERAGKVVGEAFTLSPYESVLIKSI
ncbi:MAG: DUF3459 domain-containing protein, partial [Tannerellaceae bacterium]|nr:DUF3459 domain-containing protein [Tannerellaceae bacterium]